MNQRDLGQQDLLVQTDRQNHTSYYFHIKINVSCLDEILDNITISRKDLFGSDAAIR